MTMTEIKNLIYSLSDSQGFYSRLWFALCTMEQNDPKAYARVKDEWEAKNFNDPVDFILYIEG